MNTFPEKVFVSEVFLSTVKETSCIENIRFLGGSTKNAKTPPILDRTKLMLPLDLAWLRV